MRKTQQFLPELKRCQMCQGYLVILQNPCLKPNFLLLIPRKIHPIPANCAPTISSPGCLEDLLALVEGEPLLDRCS